MLQPVALLGGRAPADPVWHCAVRAAPEDPDLGDGAWMRIAAEVMDRTGLSRHGEEDEGVRWVAVHHGDNHIHIVATLARQDGRRASLDNERWKVVAAMRDIEAEYGLRVVDRARPDRGPQAYPGRGREGGPGRAGRAAPGHAAPPRARPPRPGPGPSRSSSPRWSGAGCGSGCGTASTTRAR